MTPRSALESLLKLLDEGKPLTDEERRFIADGLRVYFTTPKGSLDKTLGLRSWGGVSPDRADAIARRDRLLVRLWQGHDAFRDKPALAAAKLMCLSADRYQSTRWAREKSDLSAPSSEPAATWWRVLRLGMTVPGAKRLQQILQREIQDGV